jgi:putative membrane protein
MTPRHLTRIFAMALLIPGAACFHLHRSSPAAAKPAAAKPAAANPVAAKPAAPNPAAANPAAANPVAAKPAAALAKAPAAKSSPAKSSAKVALPSEANVAAMLLAAGNSDLSYAKIAGSRAQSQAVKDFANRMTRDNATVNQLVNDVMTRIQVSPAENAASLEYRDESAMNRDMLRDMQGPAFDSTYIANEVAHHAKLLATIDNLLTPAAKTAQVKQLIASLRPVVEAELAHAEQVRTTLAAK